MIYILLNLTISTCYLFLSWPFEFYGLFYLQVYDESINLFQYLLVTVKLWLQNLLWSKKRGRKQERKIFKTCFKILIWLWSEFRLETCAGKIFHIYWLVIFGSSLSCNSIKPVIKLFFLCCNWRLGWWQNKAFDFIRVFVHLVFWSIFCK